MSREIIELLVPENDIEKDIVNSEEFIVGAYYGKARRGHPEGKILYHIKEVLNNIDKFYGDDKDRTNLRIIALVHDTFKYLVDNRKPKSGENHHGKIASRFAEKFPINSDLLIIIDLHDEAYNAWCKGAIRGDWSGANKRARNLINVLLIENCLDLYVKFYHCDNASGDKGQEDYEWFRKLIH